MRRLLALAIPFLVAACDEEIPPDALLCASSIALHANAFSQDVIVVGLPKAELRVIDYRLESVTPDRPGLHRATCRIAMLSDGRGQLRPHVQEIALEAEQTPVTVTLTTPGLGGDAAFTNMARVGTGNLGFDVPGYKPLWVIASRRGRCPDTVDLDKRTVTFYGLDEKASGCKVVSVAPLNEAACSPGAVNAYDGGAAAWSYVDGVGRKVSVVNCIPPETFQRQRL